MELDAIQPLDQPATVNEASTIATVEASVSEEAIAQQSEGQYVFYQHDFSTPIQLLATTANRYNTTVVETLQAEKDIIQQRVDTSSIHDGNNHFRNVKW